VTSTQPTLSARSAGDCARCLLGAIAVAALGMGVASCGGSSDLAASRRPSSAVSTGRHVAHSVEVVPSYLTSPAKDRDEDADRNDDDEASLSYGRPASRTDRLSSVVLIKRYFIAAAAGDGRAACGLLVPFIAESVVEMDGHSPELRGKTCPVVLSKLFRRHHRLLAEKNASLRVDAVRVQGQKALAVLDFPAIPVVRLMTERRVGHAWRLLPLLDGMLE
jgi:hypothetical protein